MLNFDLYVNEFHPQRPVWLVSSLWHESRFLVPKLIPIDEVMLKQLYLRKVITGLKGVTERFEDVRTQMADLNYPVILSANGSIMDGWRRLAKTHSLGYRYLMVVQFDKDPLPMTTLPELLKAAKNAAAYQSNWPQEYLYSWQPDTPNRSISPRWLAEEFRPIFRNPVKLIAIGP